MTIISTLYRSVKQFTVGYILTPENEVCFLRFPSLDCRSEIVSL